MALPSIRGGMCTHVYMLDNAIFQKMKCEKQSAASVEELETDSEVGIQALGMS